MGLLVPNTCSRKTQSEKHFAVIVLRFQFFGHNKFNFFLKIFIQFKSKITKYTFESLKMHIFQKEMARAGSTQENFGWKTGVNPLSYVERLKNSGKFVPIGDFVII